MTKIFTGTKDGRRRCKLCAYTIYHKDPEKYRKKRRLYRINNKNRINLYMKDWSKRNPERRRFYEAKRLYGITQEKYQALITLQSYSCAICKDPLRGRSMHLDHDHETKAIRGFLCNRCNIGLGLFRDSKEFLTSAIIYLQKYKQDTAA